MKEAQPAQQSNWARNLKIGAAAVAGGTILAVTGAVHVCFASSSCAMLCCAQYCTAGLAPCESELCLSCYCYHHFSCAYSCRFAVTGGLAAPALAAVAGSVATTIGGSAAAATAVTGMMGSSVGAASMIAGFGYYGGRVTAEHMARRIGELASHTLRIMSLWLIEL